MRSLPDPLEYEPGMQNLQKELSEAPIEIRIESCQYSFFWLLTASEAKTWANQVKKNIFQHHTGNRPLSPQLLYRRTVMQTSTDVLQSSKPSLKTCSSWKCSCYAFQAAWRAWCACLFFAIAFAEYEIRSFCMFKRMCLFSLGDEQPGWVPPQAGRSEINSDGSCLLCPIGRIPSLTPPLPPSYPPVSFHL